MKEIYIVVTTCSEFESDVEICYSAKEASDYIKACIGEIFIDYVEDKEIPAAIEELESLEVERDDERNIIYACVGDKDFYTIYEVIKKEVKVND